MKNLRSLPTLMMAVLLLGPYRAMLPRLSDRVRLETELLFLLDTQLRVPKRQGSARR